MRKVYFSKVIVTGLIGIILIFAGSSTYAQIDSRNQTKAKTDQGERPVKSQKLRPRKGKKKKVKSNRKQVRASRKSFSKKGDLGYQGDIAGRKRRKTKTPRKTYARPAPDPYSKRRIRTEADRAGPPLRRVVTATKKGEKARSGDISGQKRVRQKSTSSARKVTYPQPNPYVGRSVRTEKKRAYSNKKERRNIRSQSKPTETRAPKYSAPPTTKRRKTKAAKRKNVYRNHERRKGEQSTNKDISGRKLRTRNYRSTPPAGGGVKLQGVNPYMSGRRYSEGERFKNYKSPSSARSTRQPGERTTSQNLRGKQNQRMRNYRSSRPKNIYQAKSVRSSSRPSGGERAVYGKSRHKPIRSVSNKPKSKSSYRKRPAVVSASGGRRIYKQKNTYREKDRRFSGENSSSKDITGRRLRTRNNVSPRPVYPGMNPYARGSASRSRPGKYSTAPIRSASRTRPGKYNTPPIRSASRAKPGRYNTPPVRSASRTRPGKYNTPPIRSASRTKPGKYNTPPIRSASRNKPGNYGTKPIRSGSKSGWNNNNQSLQRKDRGPYANASTFRGKHSMSIIPNYSDSKVGQYQGNVKSRKPLRGAGGSISGRWNNDGQPLRKKRRGPYASASTFRGKHPSSIIPSYSESKIGNYQGRLKGNRKPLRGAGRSITRRWNNDETPIAGSSMPSGVGRYKGNIKADKPLKGAGGSITVHWNNNGLPLRKKDQGYPVGEFIGKNKSVKARSLNKSPGTEYGVLKKFAFITIGDEGGYMRTPTPISSDQADRVHPKVKKRKIEQSEGTERGRTRSLAFLKLGDPNKAGLVSKYPQQKKNKALPSELRKSNKMRHKASPGTELGRTYSLSFIELGNPKRSGLISKSSLFGKPKKIKPSEGLDRGKETTLSFWAYGDPTHGGFKKNPTLAKGRMHPSSQYNKRNQPTNSIEEKDKVFKFKLWWAQLFKKGGNQPDAVKEEPRKPRYDKRERDIWETEARENWYK